jgi:hypothetical protein
VKAHALCSGMALFCQRDTAVHIGVEVHKYNIWQGLGSRNNTTTGQPICNALLGVEIESHVKCLAVVVGSFQAASDSADVDWGRQDTPVIPHRCVAQHAHAITENGVGIALVMLLVLETV